jgi:hypothetical protein
MMPTEATTVYAGSAGSLTRRPGQPADHREAGERRRPSFTNSLRDCSQGRYQASIPDATVPGRRVSTQGGSTLSNGDVRSGDQKCHAEPRSS